MGNTTHQLKKNMCVCLSKSGISIEWQVKGKNYIQTNLSESKWGLNGFILLTEKWRFHQENTWASGFKQLRLSKTRDFSIFQWFVCTNKSTKKGAGVQTTMNTDHIWPGSQCMFSRSWSVRTHELSKGYATTTSTEFCYSIQWATQAQSKRFAPFLHLCRIVF